MSGVPLWRGFRTGFENPLAEGRITIAGCNNPVDGGSVGAAGGGDFLLALPEIATIASASTAAVDCFQHPRLLDKARAD
jgi:hypothetical protein